MKKLKYTGKFKDLIPLGYRFQKMYASNYRCYYRCYHTYNVKESDAKIAFWIWQKGKSIEIEDWSGFEAPIIEYIQTHPFTPHDKQCGKITLHIEYVALLCNRKTFEVREATHEDIIYTRLLMSYEEEGKITKEKHDELYKEYAATYRIIVVAPAVLLSMLKVLEGRYEIIEEAL
jgi:hypothetical protein